MNYTLNLMQWLETEIVRLSHLRDRASEKGRRKEYPLLFNAFLFSQFMQLDCFVLLAIS